MGGMVKAEVVAEGERAAGSGRRRAEDGPGRRTRISNDIPVLVRKGVVDAGPAAEPGREPRSDFGLVAFEVPFVGAPAPAGCQAGSSSAARSSRTPSRQSQLHPWTRLSPEHRHQQPVSTFPSHIATSQTGQPTDDAESGVVVD